jgi:glycerol kinase
VTVAILAIDQGTSGTKALVHDGDQVLAVVERPVQPRYLAGGGVELDPRELLDSVLAAGRAAVAQAGDPALEMVALANQGESVLAWNPADGSALSPVIVWQDRRAEEICQELAPQAETIAERTGLVLDPYFSGPKMTWIRRHVATEGVVTTTDSWLVHHLTGAFVTDATTASRSLLLDIDSLAWNPTLLTLFGLSDERTPAVVANDEVVGHTGHFGGDVPVGGLIVDQQAALAAQRCLTPGDAKCTYGTGAFLLANTGDRAVRSASGITSSAAWWLAKERAYCLDAQAYTLGSAFRWLTDLGVLSDPVSLDTQCADDTDGVVFVPGLAGMASPWWSTDATGALLGMSLSTGAGQVVRAVVDGLASQVAVLAGLVGRETGVPLTRLRVDGGLTRSRVLMQAQADLLQVPVDCYPSPHATALGAVAMGRLAADSGLTLDEAVPTWAPSVTYEPRWSADRAAASLAAWEAGVDMALSWASTP